ncbi:porin [Caldimonas thermodepolymerans]|uniref:porin n=1 Tax=Caldimonas thermodepolymerans TaxID=215580 RepID=UPI002235D91E|nr:porin [Caldimonas thermodepolymerans]UZG44461.1 porin [Caldimonas thermodepolymerans]
MKKTLIAIAAFGALAGAAQAQSQVTLYGRVDLGLTRNIGNDFFELQQNSGSRLGVRGVEDLGGGLKAVFNIEHRFTADNGQAADTFWAGRSVVGLQGRFGEVVLGREYVPARNIANKADPWGADTVAAFESILRGGVYVAGQDDKGNDIEADLLPVRQNNSITYTSPVFSGLQAQAQVALDEVAGNDTKAFYSVNLTYTAGPVWVGYGYSKAGKDDRTWHLLSGSYDFGVAKVIAAYGQGKPEGALAADKHRSYLIGATAPLAGGELRVAYGKLEAVDPDEDLSSKFGIGYHYPLSKRTTVYVDVARDGEVNEHKTGVDFGLKHNF